MKISDFDYHLPKELIAQTPIEPRDASRLMIVERKRPIDWEDSKRGGKITHAAFSDIKGYLNPSDCLVLNDTRVIAARLIGERKGTKGQVELLLLKRRGDNLWEALVRPSRRLKPGSRVLFGPPKVGLSATILDELGEGKRLVDFETAKDFDGALKEVGILPLPPYITEELSDPERYQTVYSRAQGSVAAPTAGLHFTKDLISELKEVGVRFAHVTLDVGLDTFRPIKMEDPRDHKIHTERFSLSQAAADAINLSRKEKGRIIAVGTTSVRVLETAAGEGKDGNQVSPKDGLTSLFIYPGYRFRIVDALITNFHLPKSSLLLMVSAFAGTDLIKRAYEEAISERYRFFSFGDAMLII
ncbi:MAG: tRNA preQ1(34) S-adenosylmethionine ribosyltransferase-isomerase QueA [Actinomycetota bacterium]|nr:tRNA preQ1(34) S-adenosylmethionine ribosyltransferase-isomerase QueA [Actinomycetota bacterium]